MLEWDRYLIQSVKSKLGSEITRVFESMINDVILWWENRQEFRDYLESNYYNIIEEETNLLENKEKTVEPVVISDKIPNEIEKEITDDKEAGKVTNENEIIPDEKVGEKITNELIQEKEPV